MAGTYYTAILIEIWKNNQISGSLKARSRKAINPTSNDLASSIVGVKSLFSLAMENITRFAITDLA